MIEVSVGEKVIRVMTGYGPQETWTPDQRMPFFMSLEEEISKAELAGRSIMLCFDANSKMGSVHIPGDPHSQSENGTVLEGIFERHAISVANGLVGKVKGVITRERTTKNNFEESAIDLVCLSQDLVLELESITVDEPKEYCLESINTNKKGESKVTPSDHNSIVSQFKFEWNTKLSKHKIEKYNLKNHEGQERFRKHTSTEGILSKIIDNNPDVNIATKKFLKRIKGCVSQTFKKSRFCEDTYNNEIVNLFDKRRLLRNKDDDESKTELEKIETKLSELCAEENFKKVMEEIKDIECEEGGFNMGKLWKLKKKLCPNKKEPPVAMTDLDGNLITSEKNLEKHVLEHYEKVLSNRPMKPELIQMQKDKEELCEKRIELAKQSKTEPWDMKDLEVVLKYPKKEKSHDPHDNANEIFHSNVAGSDMKVAILKLMNKIKDDLVYPEPMEDCNITSIHKRGKKNILDNYRGVFRVTVLRHILDRLLYNDVYPVIDKNLTDANVGSRKGRNIRDNLFVLNAITNSVVNGNEEACDVGVYDIYKAFDGLWAQESTNDLFDAGCVNDKLVLMHLSNQNARCAIKTSQGITKRVHIQNIIMQGTVTAGLNCTTTMDKLAEIVYENKKLLYMYKGTVEVPPLMMVDDIMTISKCSTTSSAMNATVNTFVETKKLKLKSDKCCVIHVGKPSKHCPELKVHGQKMHMEESAVCLGMFFTKVAKQNLI